MKTLLARTAGFCRGVRRATELALREAEGAPGGVATLGPLIHNPQALRLLETRGVRAAPPDAPPPPAVPLVLRAHGVAPEERERAAAGGRRLIDATCPNVLRSQARLRRNAAGENRFVLLAGDAGHAETRALAGVAGPRHTVVTTLDDVDRLADPGPALLLAQTTFSRAAYDAMAERLRARGLDVRVCDSICDATDLRQREARGLAARAEALVVVGGRDSANTRRLADIGREAGKPTFAVETADELDPAAFRGFSVVAVTAGASTPGWMTQAVLERLEKFGRRGPGERLWRGARSLARMRVLSALGALGLGDVVFRLVGADPARWELLAMLAAYLFFAYTLNRRVPPERAARRVAQLDAFFDRHRRPLLLAGAAAGLLALALAWRGGAGYGLFAGLALAELLALGYAAPTLWGGGRRGRSRSLPASKDVAVAAAWAVLLGVSAWEALPPGGEASSVRAFAFAGLLTFLLVFAKTVILDLRDLESDRLAGLDTLPGLIGERRTARLVKGAYAGLFALIAAMAALDLGPGWLWRLLVLPVYGWLLLALLERGWFRREADLRVAADAQLILAGVLVL